MKILTTFFYRILILLIIYLSSRIFFCLSNYESLNEILFLDFLEGIRFDLSALVYINIPFFIILFLTYFIRKKFLHKIINIIFYSVNIPFIVINNIDIEYYKFTQKRSTYDFFELLFLGNDAQNTIPNYLVDFWPVTLFTILQILFLLRLKEIKNYLSFNFNFSTKYNVLYNSITIIILTLLLVILARGGVQLKPIKPINAGEFSLSGNDALILNTPFCVLHSFYETPLKRYNYFTKKEINKIYSPNHKFSSKKMDKKNVVIIILESFSREFIGSYNSTKGYTPFLDSLMKSSLVFENAFANGLKSIEALPSITASIPALTTNPFITSSYVQNKFTSLADLLKKEGYNTSFYHGGERGTMGFYSFCKKAGFDDYFGMEEFNNDKFFDESWGIYDGPFLEFFHKKLDDTKSPFFTTFFSLSSHHPFVLPKDYIKRKKLEGKKIGISETITYTDYCLKIFFDKAKKSKWFKNTIFIITSDHTTVIDRKDPAFKSKIKKYKNRIGRYSIPMIIFKGDSSLIGIKDNIVQQIDVMPTVLDLLNYNKSFFSFGKSMLSYNQNWAISYLQNTYRLITNNSIIVNKKDKFKFYSDWDNKKVIKSNLHEINLLKAIKQEFNNRMLDNNLKYEN